MRTEKSSQRLCQLLRMAIVVSLFLAAHRSVEAQTQTKDKVKSYEGTLVGNATYTSNAGGHSAQSGDYAIDFTGAGGRVTVNNASFLNAATTNDEMTVAVWIKRYDIANSSV